MKILYMPIFESGSVHDTQVRNKRGLTDALMRAGNQVFELDYLARPRGSLFSEVELLLQTYAPDMVLTQLHGHDIFTPAQVAALRLTRPEAYWLNWSGDSWAHSLTGAPFVEVMRQYDLLMVAAPDALPELESLGVNAAFWQIAHEKSVGSLPDMPAYDVVFLGNVINEKRRAMLEMLRTLPYKVGIYGDWEHSDGRNVYDFGAGEALYRNARLAIADNVYADQSNYISNRPIQIMAAGGAMCLHQHVDKMAELSHGWIAGEHYVEWTDLDDLRMTIESQLDNLHLTINAPPYGKISSLSGRLEINHKRIVTAAKEHVERYHTYDARVQELMQTFMPQIRFRQAELPTG